MKCPNCNSDIIIDDVDYRFVGNKDVYGFCKGCKSSLILYFRFGKLWKYDIHDLVEDSEFGLIENPKTVTKTIYVNKR